MLHRGELFTINGYDVSEIFEDHEDNFFIVNGVQGRYMQAPSHLSLGITGMDGEYKLGSNLPPRELYITITAKGSDASDLNKKLELFSARLIDKDDLSIVFLDEPDRTYFGSLSGVNDESLTSEVYQAELMITCFDPFKYGPNQTLSFPTDEVIVNNKGTMPADPVFSMKAIKKATFVMISDGDENYNLIGKPSEVDEQIVDEKTLILSERGESLSTWTNIGTKVDGGKVSGVLGTDGTGILPSSYGTGDAWHGPALLKELPPVQDFEVEMRLRASTNRPGQAYRIEFYLFDASMNVIGKMAIWDNSVVRQQFAAEGRYGEFLGARVNYPIHSGNYLQMGDHFHGMIRMRRTGTRFEFYVARLRTGIDDTGLHYDAYTAVYNDDKQEYQGKLKYIQIHTAKFADAPAGSVPRINNLRVFEHNSALVDETPYIIDVNDIVTFDHETNDILINGEPRIDLKDFGANFFKLKKGANTIAITPAASFTTLCKFRDKYT